MNCLKYGNKIYKPEILFDKIRKNPAFFAKKHNINGYDIEQVLGIPHKDISNTEYQYLKESDFDSDGNIRPEVLAEIKAERESIIKQAQANGTYMKAPNGQPTKLNENQWVTVRTQRFKEWFGDWEKSTRIEKLKNSKPIKIAFNNEYELNRDSVKAWVLNNLRNEYTIDDTGETISLTKVGANKVTSHGIGNEAHLKSIANIPNLIKNAIFIEEKSNEKGNDKYDSYRYYVLGSELNGEPYTIKLTIGVKQGKKYYDHSLTQIEKGKLIDQINDQSVKKSFKTTGDAPLQPSSLSGVKDTKLVSILQNNSSKVVDENGEPMVVYHGARSTEQFNVFNEVKNGIYFSSNKEVAEAFKNENAYVLTINGEDFVLDKDSANALKDEVEPYWNIETMIGYNLAEDFADNINEALNNGALQIGFNEEVSNEDIIELKENTNPFFETFLNIRNPKTIDFNNEPWGGKEGTIEENLDKSKDGFIAENIIEGGLVSELPSSTTYVVFLPNQIKSATDNVGTYSEGSNDIRYQIDDSSDVEFQIAGEGNNFVHNNKQEFIPPHQGVAPASLLNAIKKKFEETNGNKAEAYKVLTQSHWYNELDTAEQNKITEKGIIDFLFDQVEKFKENKKAKTEWDKEQQLKADEQYRNDNLYNKSDEELLNDEYKAMEETDKKLRNKKPWISKEGVKKFITKVSDRQFNVKRIAMKLGMENTRNRIIAMAGASAKSKREAEAVHNSIFKGLTFEEKKDLNLIITHRRNIAIDENREARGLPQIRHQRGHTKATSTKVLGAIKNRIGEKTFAELDKRASLYFDEFKKVLGSQLKAGLISQHQYDSMIDIDYQPRLFVEHLLDAEGNLMENSKEYQQNNKLGREMIKTLSDGSFGDQVIDAEWLFKMTIGARNSQLFMNDLNQTFATRDFPQAKREYDALMKKPKAQWTKEERNIAKYFEQLQSKVKFPTKKTEDTPKGYRKAYYYENGELKFFFMEEKFYDEWYDIQKGLFANPDVKEKVTKLSGSSLVKLAATGLNSAFVITNTPKDFAQIVMFSPEYSNNSVWATMQLAKDATKGVMELIKDDMGNKDTLLAKYIEYGGGMDFLHTQGLGERENGVSKALEKVLPPKFRDRFLFGLNTISLLKLSRYSETMFRLGVFSRSMKNQLKEYNKVNGTNYKSVEEIPNETTKRDMYIGAVASARSVLDFNQGGTITKDMEAFVPYINAGVQGTRVAVDAFTQRPKQTSIRLLQAGAFFGGIGAGMSALLFSLFDDDDEEDKRSAMEKILHAYDGLSEHQRINYFNIVLPEKLENGEYRVIKISKTQAITPLAYLMEEMLLNHFRKDKDKRGAKEILKGVGLAFNQNLTPIALPTGTKATDIGMAGANVIVRTPIIKAVVSANTGWDFFRNQPLDPLTAGKKLPMELEGIKNDKVEDFYKAFGELSQDSPVRVKAMVESFITSPDTNPFITFTYGILEGIAREGSFTDNFSEYFLDEKQGGILRRGLSETKDYNRTIRNRLRVQDGLDRIIVDNEKSKAKVDDLINKYETGKISGNDVLKEINQISDSGFKEKLYKRVIDKLKNKDTDTRVWDIKYNTDGSNKAKAYLIHEYFGDFSEESNPKSLINDLKENGLLTEEILIEYAKFLNSNKK